MRILLSILLLFVFCKSFSQTTFPITQSIGGKTTNVRTEGTLGSLTGFTFMKDFLDTTEANSILYVQYTPGILIRVADTLLYLRNQTVNKWVLIGSSGGGGGGTVTGANSGLYLNGTEVRLGTNPLVEDASIQIDGFAFSIPDNTTDSKFEMNGVNGVGTVLLVAGHSSDGNGQDVTIDAGVYFGSGDLNGGSVFIHSEPAAGAGTPGNILFQVEGGGNAIAQFQQSHGRFIVENGTTQLQDTLLYEKKLFITDTTGYDFLFVQRASPYMAKIMTGANVRTALGITSTTLQGAITNSGVLSQDNTITNSGHDLLIAGAFTFLDINDAGGDIGFVVTDDFSITSPDVLLVTTPTAEVDTTNNKILTRNTNTGEIETTYWNIPGVNIYNSNGTLTSDRTLTLGGFNLASTGTGVVTWKGDEVLLRDNASPVNNLIDIGFTLHATDSRRSAIIMNNSLMELLPAGGNIRIGDNADWIPRSANTTDSVLVRDNTGNIKTRAQSAIAALAAIPTWQQTLTSGSTLSGNNTATLGTTSFTWSSTATTASTTSSPLVETYNSLTTGNGHYISSSSQTSGILLNMVMTGTAGTVKTGVSLTSTGANAGSSGQAYGFSSNIANSGTTSSNIGYYSNVTSASTSYGYYADAGVGVSSLGSGITVGFYSNMTFAGTTNIGLRTAASGASNNYAIITEGGNVGIGDATPASLLTVGSGDLFQVNSSGDMVKIKNVTYVWPSSNSSGSLTNDGSGNLSWTAAGAVTWNAITNPTGTQTLTFDDAELNAWTISSDGETFWTKTANSITTGTVELVTLNGITTGTGQNLTSTSTAALTNSEMINIDRSGTLTNTAQTIVGARISISTTNATSGTNIALSASATNALTDNWAIDATGGVRSNVGFFPTTNDGAPLGSTALQFSDLFGASGMVINFNSGNYTVTHSASLLTFSNSITMSTGSLIAIGVFSSAANGDNANLHVIASATGGTSNNAAVQLGGSSTVGTRVKLNGNTNFTLSASNSYGGFIVGSEPITEAPSGTASLSANFAVKSYVITNGTGTMTDATTSYIEGRPTGATGAFTTTNPLTAFWVATGIARFGDTLAVGTASPNSTVHLNGSVSHAYVAKTAIYSATVSDYIIDCTANTFTVTVPTAVGIVGRVYVIKNSGAGVITVAATGGQTFDGAATLTLAANISYTIVSDNANWKVI